MLSAIVVRVAASILGIPCYTLALKASNKREMGKRGMGWGEGEGGKVTVRPTNIAETSRWSCIYIGEIAS